jgi:AAA domain
VEVIPFGADYDDEGNRVGAVDAFDEEHGDPGVLWPVGSVGSVINAGQSPVSREPPFVVSVRSVGNDPASNTSNKAVGNGHAPVALLTSKNDTSNTSNGDPLEGVRFGDWLSEQVFPPLQFAVPGIVPAGFSLLVGPPKAGKSWLLLDWLLAVSMGGRALGKIPVGEPRQILYLALEDSDRRMQTRCTALLQGHGSLPRTFAYQTRIQSERLIWYIESFVEQYPETGMVAIDTLGRVMLPMLAGETTYQRDYRIGSHLQAITERHPKLAVVVAHHTRKTASSDFVDSVSGTNGLAGAADTIIVLGRDRHSSEGKLSITGRDLDEAEYGLVSEHNGCWMLEGADLAEAAEAALERHDLDNLSGMMKAILDYVTGHPQGAHSRDMAEKFGKSAYMYLTRLTEAGHIDKLERGTYILPASKRAT